MRLFTVLLAFFTLSNMHAQSTPVQSSENAKNPPSFHERVMTPQVLAEIKASEIIKACDLQDKVDISELMRICFEYELDASMEGVKDNPNELEKISAERDDKIKSLLGNQRMAQFESWKSKTTLELQPGNQNP